MSSLEMRDISVVAGANEGARKSRDLLKTLPWGDDIRVDGTIATIANSLSSYQTYGWQTML